MPVFIKSNTYKFRQYSIKKICYNNKYSTNIVRNIEGVIISMKNFLKGYSSDEIESAAENKDIKSTLLILGSTMAATSFSISQSTPI